MSKKKSLPPKLSDNDLPIIGRKFKISMILKDITAVEIDRFSDGTPKRLRILEIPPDIENRVLQPYEYHSLVEI